MKTELTEMAIRAKEEPGVLDGILLKWQRKVKLEGWVRNKTLQDSDTNDLKQEVLMNIVERFGEYDEHRAAFETWAFNRARQVIRSWVRKRCLEKAPVLKKGFRGRESIRGKIGPIPEGDIITYPEGVGYVDEFEGHVQMIGTIISEMDMQERNRETTRKTFKMLAEEQTKKEIAEELGITKGKVEANIKRIRKAYGILEEAKMLV